MTNLTDQEFKEKSIELYKEYERNSLFYTEVKYYNKLVTADPFFVSESDYKAFKENGKAVCDWLIEQNELFLESFFSPSLKWLKQFWEKVLPKDALETQLSLAKLKPRLPEIFRVDLSSLPFGSHEAQLRWGGNGHLHHIPEAFKKLVPIDKDEEEINSNLIDAFQNVIDKHCVNDDECCLLMYSYKYKDEMKDFTQYLRNTYLIPTTSISSEYLLVQGNKLIHKESGKTVKLIFRKELNLLTLLSSDMGRQLVDLAMDNEVVFEPNLNLINDMKLGMAFAFDPRTSQFFSDKSRSLFLPTSLYDRNMESFNMVFDKEYASFEDFITSTSQKERDYVFKYGGPNLPLSHGSSNVFRIDRSRNVSRKVINESIAKIRDEREWIIQKFDNARFDIRFLKGNYTKPETCTAEIAYNCPARIMLIYKTETNGEVNLVNGLANFVNDYWKARFKNSSSEEGKGAIITTIRVRK